MDSTKTDIASINKAILENPTCASSREVIGLLELGDPDLKFLCPLAKAIYLAETTRLDKDSSAEALATIWCIDDNFASDTSWTCVQENVLHEIEVDVNNKTITLGFDSTTEMTHYSDFWPSYVRSVSADEWVLDKERTYPEILERIFCLLDEESTKGSPNGYPTDSGEFIGTSSYQLISIGGLPIDGPTFRDSYHEQSWEGLLDSHGEPYPEDEENEPGGFYWHHYLSKRQAEQLGLAASGDEAVGPDGEHPEWTPRDLAEEDNTNNWISTDMLYNSYSEGKLQVEPSEHAHIAVGCGKDWDPSSNPDEHEELDEDLDLTEYPSDAPPLIRIEIQRGSEECPDGLAKLLPYLKLFHAELSIY